ncbi:transposase [Kitasatospora sp. NPDC049258]|uniref:transposase n=1 Tax=Kitasatospora sp. NPDC049258 TaxID=3155394 RepID=UPI0034263409
MLSGRATATAKSADGPAVQDGQELRGQVALAGDQPAQGRPGLLGPRTSGIAGRPQQPQLLDCYGVGPDTAAALLTAAGDNPDRMNGEGSFAALCGVSPVEASSGRTQRRRLNRGGDRQANSALCAIVLARLRWERRSREYLERRIAEGRTRREAIRCLKRYVAREIYRLITAARKPTPTPASAG